MTKKNSITLFADGTADFSKFIPLTKNKITEVQIPVKRENVGDILCTLNVFGATISEPPSYTSPDSNKRTISLNTDDIYGSISQKLVGSKIKITKSNGKTVEGTLVGRNQTEAYAGNTEAIVKIKSFVIRTTAVEAMSLTTVLFDEVNAIEFLDEAVNSELTKALEKDFESIKPESSFVRLKLIGSKDESEALVQYTVPAAAWKITYRLRDPGSGLLILDGLAVVDNPTEDDWRDVDLSVVTGKPISFSTDLASIKASKRQKINFVDENAQEAVESAVGVSRRPQKSIRSRSSGAAKMQLCSLGFSGSPSPAFESTEYEESSFAETETEVSQVGDYSVFKSINPVTILAGQSALIPVFHANLSGAEIVLYYDEKRNRERAYRSIKLFNETGYNLNRGPCNVVEKGIHQGQAIFPESKPGEKHIISYALDAGVRFLPKDQDTSGKNILLKIADGVMLEENMRTLTREFYIKNVKDESFTINFDYKQIFHDKEAKRNVSLSNGTEVKEELIPGGSRYSFTLDANQELTFSVIEEFVEKNTISFQEFNAQNIFNSVLGKIKFINKDLLKNDGILVCLGIVEQINQTISKNNSLRNQIQQLENRCTRLRANIESVGAKNAVDENVKWTGELAKFTDEIARLEDVEIPKIEKESEDLHKELFSAMRNINFTATS